MCPGYRETAETNSEKRRGIWPAMLAYGRFATTWGLGAGHESTRGARGAASRRAAGRRGGGRGNAGRGGGLLVIAVGARLAAHPCSLADLPGQLADVHGSRHRAVVGAAAGIGLVR